MPFDIKFFEKENGAFPAEAFILGQSQKMQSKIFRDLGLLEEHGYELREPYSSFLEDGIFELRTIQGNKELSKNNFDYFFNKISREQNLNCTPKNGHMEKVKSEYAPIMWTTQFGKRLHNPSRQASSGNGVPLYRRNPNSLFTTCNLSLYRGTLQSGCVVWK